MVAAICNLTALLLAAPVEPVTAEVVEVSAPAEPVAAPAQPPVPALERVSTGRSPALARVPNEKPPPTWWGPFPRPRVTGFGGPVLNATGLNGAFGAMFGVGGGLTIRRRVSLGGQAMWLLNPVEAGHTSFGAAQRLNINFGGLLIAVVVARTRRLDFTVEGLIGGGGACLQNPVNGNCYARTSMFVGQPGLAMHIGLTPIVRLALGLGYRFVAARAWDGPGNRQLGAPVGSVMLEFGWF